jgi:ComF family protein
LCGVNSGSAFCGGCRADLPWLSSSRCPSCALPVTDSKICGECLRAPPAFDRTIAAFAYSFPTDSLIHALKYERRLEVAAALGKELGIAIAASPRPDVVISVPLARSRLVERGFNQATEIAKSARLPVRSDACARVRETPPQVLLPWKERSRNIRGAFACKIDLEGQHVALVDDVMTTGATLNELARTVKRAGASEVSCWVVARTLKET